MKMYIYYMMFFSASFLSAMNEIITKRYLPANASARRTFQDMTRNPDYFLLQDILKLEKDLFKYLNVQIEYYDTHKNNFVINYCNGLSDSADLLNLPSLKVGKRKIKESLKTFTEKYNATKNIQRYISKIENQCFSKDPYLSCYIENLKTIKKIFDQLHAIKLAKKITNQTAQMNDLRYIGLENKIVNTTNIDYTKFQELFPKTTSILDFYGTCLGVDVQNLKINLGSEFATNSKDILFVDASAIEVHETYEKTNENLEKRLDKLNRQLDRLKKNSMNESDGVEVSIEIYNVVSQKEKIHMHYADARFGLAHELAHIHHNHNGHPAKIVALVLFYEYLAFHGLRCLNSPLLPIPLGLVSIIFIQKYLKFLRECQADRQAAELLSAEELEGTARYYFDLENSIKRNQLLYNPIMYPFTGEHPTHRSRAEFFKARASQKNCE